jgi:hypothetical protein
MHARHLFIAAGAALCIRRPAAGQETPRRLPQPVQELFLVETVYTQDRGEIQLTAHSRLQDETHTRLLGEYGITDHFQLSLVTPAVEGNGEDEERAWEIGALYGISLGQTPVALSAGMDVQVSGDDATQWEPVVIAARQWGPVQLHAGAGTELHSIADAAFAGLGAILDLQRVTPTLEFAASASEHESIVPGVFVHPLRGIEAGFGLPVCLRCSGQRQQARVMLTAEF